MDAEFYEARLEKYRQKYRHFIKRLVLLLFQHALSGSQMEARSTKGNASQQLAAGRLFGFFLWLGHVGCCSPVWGISFPTLHWWKRSQPNMASPWGFKGAVR
jgi:hypothetical protein